jgi:hypothetical protein
MKTYEIEMTEVQRVYYRVEAESEEDAVEKYENASVYTQICMMVDSKGGVDTMTGVREI